MQQNLWQEHFLYLEPAGLTSSNMNMNKGLFATLGNDFQI